MHHFRPLLAKAVSLGAGLLNGPRANCLRPSFLLAFVVLALTAGSDSDVPAQSWSTKAPMPTPRGARPMSGVINGKLYVAGGNVGVAGAVTTLEIYDPETDSWSTGAPMPGRRYDGGAGALSGDLYVFGGWNYPDSTIPTNTLQHYSAANNSWGFGQAIPTNISPPSGLSACSAVGVIGGKLYVLTGCNGFSGYVKHFFAFDPVNAGSYTALTPPSQAHVHPVHGVIDGLFYVAGGLDAAGNHSNVVERYNPTTNSWTTLSPLPNTRVGGDGGVLSGKLYAIGGLVAGNNVSNSVVVYDPSTDAWTSDTPMPTARNGYTSATIGSTLYVIGGSGTNGQPLGVVEALTVCPLTAAVDQAKQLAPVQAIPGLSRRLSSAIAVPAAREVLTAARQFREHVLGSTPAGRRLVELYYRHGDEVSRLLVSQPGLALEMVALARESLPALQSDRAVVAVDERVYSRGLQLLDELDQSASDRLRTSLMEVRTILQTRARLESGMVLVDFRTDVEH
jgi:N-acetylneuraminic acid mutarotase